MGNKAAKQAAKQGERGRNSGEIPDGMRCLFHAEHAPRVEASASEGHNDMPLVDGWPSRVVLQRHRPAGAAGDDMPEPALVRVRCTATDQGWGDTGYSYVVLVVLGAGEGVPGGCTAECAEKVLLCKRKLHTCTHDAAKLDVRIAEEGGTADDRAFLEACAAPGATVHLVAKSAPWPGHSCRVSHAVLEIFGADGGRAVPAAEVAVAVTPAEAGGCGSGEACVGGVGGAGAVAAVAVAAAAVPLPPAAAGGGGSSSSSSSSSSSDDDET